MRIEVENNRTPLNEFVTRVESMHETIELTRDGAVVATVNTAIHSANARKTRGASTKERARAVARGWEVVESTHSHMRKSKLSQRQIDRLIDKAVAKVRKQNAARNH